MRPCYRSSERFRKQGRGFRRRAEVHARRRATMGRSERGRVVGLDRSISGREHLIFVFEAQSESEQDLPLGIHAAVHTLFDTVNRPKGDFGFTRKLGLCHQAIFAELSNAILSNRVRFINFHNALLDRQLCSEGFSKLGQLFVVSTERRISLVGMRPWSSRLVGSSSFEKFQCRRGMRDQARENSVSVSIKLGSRVGSKRTGNSARAGWGGS